MDAELLGPLLVAVIGAVGTVVFGLVKLFHKKRDSRRPPVPDGLSPQNEILARLERIEGIQRDEQVQQAREGVHDAESRRLLADMSASQHAQARAIELVHRDGTRERQEILALLKSIEERLRGG